MDTTLKDPLVGQVLDGRYRIDARVAVGGMATVYRAMDTRLDRVLALKVMHTSLSTDETFVTRFIREAKSAARLAHQNVVGVFDQGTDGTYVYLAMEYVSGCTLRDVLRDRGALQPRAALDVLEPVLAALGAAHRAGLVHRDMKPENVLIGDDGRVKVADFGLVRAVDSQTSATTDSILGTVSYLAPEQIEDGTADTRTDLYACGVMFYEMLTGAKPHSGGTPAQVLYQHLNKDMPLPSESVPGMAAALDGLVARAAARSPEDRPDDAVALLSETRAVRAALTDTQLDAVPPQAKEQTANAAGDAEPGDADDAHDEASGALSGAAFGGASGEASGATVNGAAHGGSAGDAAETYVIPRPAPAEPAPADPRAAGAATGAGPVPDAALLDRTTRLSAPPLVPPVVPQGSDSEGGDGEVMGSVGGPGRRRRPRWGVLAAAGVVLAALLGTGIWYINSGQFIKTPPVLDKTQPQATKVLEDAGLDVNVDRDYSERVKRGHVIGTDPDPGERVRKSGSVTLTVSRGPKVVKVPDLKGTPLSDARRKLKDAGLEPGVVKRRFDEETAQGSVVSTDPSSGDERRPGAAVALTVSKGEPIDIPDVVGDEEADAADALRSEGLKVRIAAKRVFSEEDKGSVARQSPKEGARAAKGDTVTLTLSKGPDMVEVPDVEDSSEDDARQKLEQAGFSVTVRRVFFGDSVFNQSPDSGEKAPRGSEVTIWLR
ncbi:MULTISPECIES: PASTA domain-containing protein [unclassified Streptomyces]|uniref:Stk1 family PASTA domain-containing Ser/Thr kinase n=1 Tax=unclassified Streptomyces TaxID=2593676 RepID=UPI002DD8214F|nr:PASTA domain-containing protein [Streptomyces sp. NBC_01795]WSA95304.1 PASTA domain-containing protein [Streptomyces sp. NBC_01795]WSS40785.1 PASTA domain-containing protein [Streptomyces sp. NBC_01187]